MWDAASAHRASAAALCVRRLCAMSRAPRAARTATGRPSAVGAPARAANRRALVPAAVSSVSEAGFWTKAHAAEQGQPRSCVCWWPCHHCAWVPPQGYELTEVGECAPAAPAAQPDFDDHVFLPLEAPAERTQRTLFGRLVDALNLRSDYGAPLPAGLLPAGPPSPDPRAYLHPPPDPTADRARAANEASSEAESIALMVRAGEEDVDREGEQQAAAQGAARLEGLDPIPEPNLDAPVDADWQRRWGWLAWASAGSADAVALAAQAALPRDDGDTIWETQVPCARALEVAARAAMLGFEASCEAAACACPASQQQPAVLCLDNLVSATFARALSPRSAVCEIPAGHCTNTLIPIRALIPGALIPGALIPGAGGGLS